MTTPGRVSLRPGDDDVAPDALGHPRVAKARATDTRGAYTLTESSKPPGLGAPPHVHHEHEEAFYVIEGEITAVVDGERVTATAGSFLLVPRGIEHSFDVTGDTPARYLCIFSPPITDRERESIAAQLREMDRSKL